MGPVFYGAMRLTGITNQRSQATNLAVAATEQMRSFPYSEVGFHTTPSTCTNGTPVTLPAPGPLDALPASKVVGRTTYTVVRCVYWSASSMPGTNQAYKQTLVKVSWLAPGGTVTVSQTSALFPGSSAPSVPSTTTTTTTLPQTLLLPPTCLTSSTSTNSTSLSVTEPPGGTTPWYYLAYYTSYPTAGNITAGANPYTTVQITSIATPTALNLGAGSTYAIQVSAVAHDGTMSGPGNTCYATTSSPPGTTTTTTTTSYSSQATATALTLSLGGSTVPYAIPPESASNNGNPNNDNPQSSQPAPSIPGADSFLTASGVTETAEAKHDASSYACAGVLSNGNTLSGGSWSSPCTPSGTGTGGISINLAGLPGVGSAINTVVGGLTLNLSGATSWASDSPSGSSQTGSATLSGATVKVSTVGGLVTQTVPLVLPSTLTACTDVVAAMIAAISSNSLVATVASPLQRALSPVLTLTGGCQTDSGGVLTVSALHITLLSGGGTGDLALSSVGQDSATPMTTTTTTPAPCSIYSLVVYPTTGPGGSGGVALTASGTLADESSLQLSVNIGGTGCSGIQVVYGPSGCTPGASGCTTITNLTPNGGTLYGSAGTASTVWNVGSTSFTVFSGSALSNPLEQQNVVFCTEQGSTGQC